MRREIGEVIYEPKYPGTHRDEAVIDRVIGPRRKLPLERVDWSDCPLRKAYPTWIEFHEQIAAERAAAAAEGRAPHPAAAPPPTRAPIQEHLFPGPSAAKIKRAFPD